jgi:hypothetical protein
MSVVFDIETEPLSLEELGKLCDPFDPASVPHPGEFDESAVKLGNLKDAAKIAEKIELARHVHAKSVMDYESTLDQACGAYWSEIFDKAALDATTGRVCAVGYLADSKEIIDTALDFDERELLVRFWNIAGKMRKENRKMIGHYSNSFDVPFLVRRSWILGIPVPDWITTPTGYLNPMFIDTMAVWQVGNRRDSIKLDRLARALQVGCKPSDCTGADFWRMLRGEGAEREAAIEYLRNDLKLPYEIAKRLGLL